MIYLERYPESLINGTGLISSLTTNAQCPWANSVTADSIEKAYCFRSGYKKLVGMFTTEVDPTAFLLAYYGQKWTKLWTSFTHEYNITNATYIDETETATDTGTITSETDYGRTVDNTGTVTDSGNSSSDSSASAYGFNSADPVPTNTADSSNEYTDTRTDNLKQTEGGTDTSTRTLDTTRTTTTDRKGNIGWFTPQNMLRDDIELWMRNYFDIVFADIDKLICLEVYS